MSQPPKRENRLHTLIFVVVLCFVCGFVLSFLATALREPQQKAAKLNQIKELLTAAKILNKEGYLPNEKSPATTSAIFAFYDKSVQTLFTDTSGKTYTPKEAGLDVEEYILEHHKKGYAHLKYKLYYRIEQDEKLYALVIPVNGFGLWDAIYGYIAIKADGVHVLGTTWYEQKETPGLGAEIAAHDWQKQFFNKSIFQMDGGVLNMDKDPVGIIVVKGKVSEVLGTSSLSKSAVDGLAGATLTGEGVTQAYRNSLSPYRALLEKTAKGAS